MQMGVTWLAILQVTAIRAAPHVLTACGPAILFYVHKGGAFLQIKVRLFATLREGRGKEIVLELGDSPIVQDVIDTLKIKSEDISILLKNGRDTSRNQALSEGDTLSIFPPVGGG